MNMLKKSGPNEGYTGRFPVVPSILFFLVLAVVSISLLPWSKPQKVEAQFAGQSTFSLPFSINVPGTVGTREYVTIPNRGQTAETISYDWSAVCSGTGVTQNFYLEGSNDNSRWFVLSSSVPLTSTPSSAVMYSNGYFTYKRISFPPCETDLAPATFTGIYTGYGTPLPLNPVATLVEEVSAQVFSNFTPTGLYLIQGFQCFNPNASTAYLIFQNPALIIGIAAEATYTYQGPAFTPPELQTNIGAYTTPAATVAVSTALPCTFELSTGPFYPVTTQIFY
jgi:hypothetical protein